MSRQQLIILGTGALAEEILDVASESSTRDQRRIEVVAFAENLDRSRIPGPLLELPVHWVDDLATMSAHIRAVCAIGTTRRSRFVEQVQALGMHFATVVHESARISRTSALGPGSILSVGSIIAAHTRLGSHVFVNRGCLIGHHTAVGDYVTISPGANIGGRVRIGDRCYVGMGATVLNDITIGEGAIVGAGAVVTKDVPPRTQVLGIPARVTKEDVEPL